MERATFIAKLLGPFILVGGVGMLVNQSIYQAMISDFLHSTALVYLSGVLSLLAGLAIVNVHNSWTSGWSVVITVIGWLMLIGAMVRLVLPQLAIGLGTTIYGSSAALVVVAVVSLVLGGFLTFKGYRQ
jgi:uncharacterized membrane protein